MFHVNARDTLRIQGYVDQRFGSSAQATRRSAPAITAVTRGVKCCIWILGT